MVKYFEDANSIAQVVKTKSGIKISSPDSKFGAAMSNNLAHEFADWIKQNIPKE